MRTAFFTKWCAGARRMVALKPFVAAALAAVPCVTVSGCESAAERCKKAQGAAEQAWQTQLTTLDKELHDAKRIQTESETTLVREIEPRLARAAAEEASRRYDRNTDAWMRAYQSVQNSACAADAECARAKHDELVPKIESVKAALAAVHGKADDARRAADAVVPEQGNVVLQTARTASTTAYTACKDVPVTPQPAH